MRLAAVMLQWLLLIYAVVDIVSLWQPSVEQLELFDGRVRINRPGDIISMPAQIEKKNKM